MNGHHVGSKTWWWTHPTLGERIDPNPNEVSTDLSGSPEHQGIVTHRISAFCGKILGQFPTPDQHLLSMFGIGIATSMLMLFTMPCYFWGCTDVDTQTRREAQYQVDINCDRWAEFANLPNIGEKTAKAIVKHGQEVGGFHSVEQLLEAKGVGTKTLAKIRPFLVATSTDDMTQQPYVPKNLISGD